MSIIDTEIQREKDAIAYAVKKSQYIVHERISKQLEHLLPHGLAIQYKLIDSVVAQIDNFFKTDYLTLHKQSNLYRLMPDFKKLGAKTIAYITLRSLINCLTKEKNYTDVAAQIGIAVWYQCETIPALQYNNYHGDSHFLPNLFANKKNKFAKVPEKYFYSRTVRKYVKEEFLLDWNNRDLVNIGNFCIEMIFKTTDIFTVEMRYKNKKTKRVLLPNATTKEYIKHIKDTYSCIGVKQEPLLAPPMDWAKNVIGGYYEDDHAIKTFIKNNRDFKGSIEIHKNHDMPEVYSAVNYLQKTGLTIHKPTFAVLKNLYKNKRTVAGLPTQNEIFIPNLSDLKAKLGGNLKTVDNVKYVSAIRRHECLQKFKIANLSKTCVIERLIALAEKYKNKTFYNSAFVDSRGRIYTASELSFLNNECTKSILNFARGKTIGTKKGEEALAIYGANSAGLDRECYKTRLNYIYDNELEIIDIANNPTTNLSWTDKSEPWLYLRFCFEWRDYRAAGYAFVSHLPVLVDATCSGLQHSSALLGDASLAKYVNMTNTRRPTDIYKKLAGNLSNLVSRDALRGTRTVDKLNNKGNLSKVYGTKELAKIWKSLGITRKTVKSGVMTYVYSATHEGRRKQILEKILTPLLEQFYKNEIKNIPFTENHLFPLAQYLATKLEIVLSDKLACVLSLMKYLQKTVAVVPVCISYTTPTNFKFNSSYYDQRKTETKLSMRGRIHTVRLKINSEDKKPAVNKQKSSITPNLIHSLDASHLTKVINSSSKKMHSIVTIHDCIGTHACDIPELQKIIRTEFVNLYKHDVLLDFHKQVQQQVVDVVLPAVPQRKGYDVHNVMKAKYFFN